MTLEVWIGHLYGAAISKNPSRIEETQRIVRDRFEADARLKAAAMEEHARLKALADNPLFQGNMRQRCFVSHTTLEMLSAVLDL